MNQQILERDEVINLPDEISKLLRREFPANLQSLDDGRIAEPARSGMEKGLESLLGYERNDTTSNNLLLRLRLNTLVQNSQMTVASFVENKFVPEHVVQKRSSGRIYYQAMLKHVLMPEDVERMFHVVSKASMKKLRAVRGWPYLGDVRLCDVRPEHVYRIISAALAHGYSLQTVQHIRNVVSAIFSHAQQEQCLVGDNPAARVKLPEVRGRQAAALTVAQAREAIGVMRYPEREMILIAVFTDMNLAEILGLQWKHVNLTEGEAGADSAQIAPMTIAVRNQWYRGKLEPVKSACVRNLPVSQPLRHILLGLRDRAKFTGPDDFVLVSQAGTPVNQNNVLARRLRPIAKQLGVPSLSWQAFRRNRDFLAIEFGNQFQDFAVNPVCSGSLRNDGARPRWRCRTQRERGYASGTFELPLQPIEILAAR